MLTFTLVSNKTSNKIKRLYFPRFILIPIVLLAISPIVLLIYHLSLNSYLKISNQSLTERVENLKNDKDVLLAEVQELESERDTVLERYRELNEIEEKFHQYIIELPDEALGGIEIPINDEEFDDLDLDDTELMINSTVWIDRYLNALDNIEQLDQNLQSIPFGWPTEPNTITSSFGSRNDPFNRSKAFHSGIDVRGAIGTPIYTPANGVVTLAESSYGGYGKTIKVDHGGRYETLFAHLSEINVEVGDIVEKGDIIGAIGSTGRSTGPHLHYEVLKDGIPVDPEYYINFFATDQE